VLEKLWAFIREWNESRPPATTFAEGQQALMVKLLARAGIACTLMVVALAIVLIRGHWPASEQHFILEILGGIVALYGLTNLAVVVSFSIGGPVGRLDLEATRQGFKLGAAKENDNGPSGTSNAPGKPGS
jgi:hypothetical protein